MRCAWNAKIARTSSSGFSSLLVPLAPVLASALPLLLLLLLLLLPDSAAVGDANDDMDVDAEIASEEDGKRLTECAAPLLPPWNEPVSTPGLRGAESTDEDADDDDADEEDEEDSMPTVPEGIDREALVLASP